MAGLTIHGGGGGVVALGGAEAVVDGTVQPGRKPSRPRHVAIRSGSDPPRSTWTIQRPSTQPARLCGWHVTDAPAQAETRVCGAGGPAGVHRRSVGAQLFVSARTVERRLRKVFANLGIGSRRELRGALADGRPLARA
jgi:hypothetical protein